MWIRGVFAFPWEVGSEWAGMWKEGTIHSQPSEEVFCQKEARGQVRSTAKDVQASEHTPAPEVHSRYLRGRLWREG